ncbi:MAG: MbtH family NRPS accessory protein [Alphaproteobacteria bacterium]|jgi:MbtH protein|nr:MbtH family NRPS accessory protein [Alphaproteobacteria bacterium]MCI5058140.1 MbtH family NRPS accessory protein [Flavobacteriales bacterium]
MSDVLSLADTWCVVINLEDQYSIWPAKKEIPYGWREEGKIGTKEDCLAHVKEVWVDMRPRSLKEAMAVQIQAGAIGG